ncbi:MAG: ECF RNA polymerase sigma factor SigW [Firmicutes bacterium ADurb.Bin300]|jgi:RNA polymerase sigma factor (sigma-70 family)|nr:MAG: ECF RNA polymerase sigma factor SigW [Firmicutes bacterium ADurb.Bin300]HOD02520.1 RNA polymerase sigma factor [Clostridiales bacterium]
MTDTTMLVILAKSGDVEAFAQLYDYYSTDMFRYASYLLNSPLDAEDAVQETVLSAFRKINSLEKNEAFKSWLFKILTNCCKNILKIRGKTPDSLPEDEYFFSIKDDTLSDTGAALELTEAIKSLPPPDGQIVLLSVLGGFKSHELAQIFQMPAGTVRSKLKRSLERLRTMLPA